MKKERRKNATSSQFQFCYTSEELFQYRFREVPPQKRSEIFQHLNIDTCQRCRGIYQSLKDEEVADISVDVTQSIIKKLKRKKENFQAIPTPIRLEKGQIWTTSTEVKNIQGDVTSNVQIGIPVLIISPGNGEKRLENSIKVVPVSDDIDFHWKNESLVLKTSPLKYPILIEIFNERPMFAGNLGKYRGSVTKKDLSRIISIRNKFFDGEKIKPDQAYLEWKEKEIEMTNYLTFPVNEAIWDDEKESEMVNKDTPETVNEYSDFSSDTPVIRLETYRKAADTSGLALSEITPHVLFEGKDSTLAIIQKRDKVFLRFISDTINPAKLKIDGKSKSMKKKQEGLFETTLGFVSTLTGTVEIKLTINKQEYTFNREFRFNDEQ